MVKLVVHIGHGKTGSSSIQQSLLAAETQLAEQRVKYLGLMLEHANTPERKTWQKSIGSNTFFDLMSQHAAVSELSEVLSEEMDKLKIDGYRLAIWSNEWILERPDKVLPVLLDLEKSGIDLEIQAFVRRHDKWAASAYTQWGLRHKIYAGPILPFDQWLAKIGNNITNFFPVISRWSNAFPERFRIMNFDAAGDVVQHFTFVNGLKDIVSIHENVSPDAAFLLAQALFNTRSKAPVLPTAFDKIQALAHRADENRIILPRLDSLAPSAETLAALIRDRAEDIAEINKLLIRSGEPRLSFDTPPRQTEHPSCWEMNQLLLKLVFNLAEDVSQLKELIFALEKQLDAFLVGQEQ